MEVSRREEKGTDGAVVCDRRVSELGTWEHGPKLSVNQNRLGAES